MHTLVIGDSHVEAGQDLSRFGALSNYIIEHKPDTIVNIGDFLSLDCLSHWDYNHRATMENRRYQQEIIAGNNALDSLEYQIDQYNGNRAKNKKSQYRPRKIWLEGNHEDRLYRYLIDRPELIGALDYRRDMLIEYRGWEIVEYKDFITLDGVSFTHVPIGNDGRPISSKYITTRAAEIFSNNVVFGHSHRFSIDSNARHGEVDSYVTAINVGCFFEHRPVYSLHSNGENNWWRGIVEIYHDESGYIDFERISLNKLKEIYG